MRTTHERVDQLEALVEQMALRMSQIVDEQRRLLELITLQYQAITSLQRKHKITDDGHGHLTMECKTGGKE